MHRKIRQTTYLVILFALVVLLSVPASQAAENLIENGIQEYKSENYEEALTIFLKAREQQPDSSLAAFYLGLCYKQVGEYQLAEKNLRDSVSLSPAVKDSYIELAEVLYTRGKLDEALNWIARSEEENVKPAYAAFLKGLVYAKKGNTKDAVEAFKKAKAVDPALSQMADFQIAIAQVKDRRFDDARKSLNTIREIDPASDIALFAKEYDRALEKTMASYQPWRLTAGLAYQYDDNVVLKPSSSIPGVDITGESDSSIVGTFGIEYTPLLSSPWFLNAQYNFYSNTYFKTTSHNLLIHTVSLAPGLNFSNNSLSLPLSYTHAWVNNQEYMSLLAVKPTFQRAFAPQHIGQLSLGYASREMLDEPIDSDEDRDGEIWNISAGYIHPFWNNRGVFNIFYEFSQDNTDGRNWDNDGNRFVLSLLMPVYKDEVKTVISGDIFLQDYKNINTVFEKKRKDETYIGYVTLIWTLHKNLNMNLQYSHTRADSNIAVYDYTRNIYTAGIEYRF